MGISQAKELAGKTMKYSGVKNSRAFNSPEVQFKVDER